MVVILAKVLTLEKLENVSGPTIFVSGLHCPPGFKQPKKTYFLPQYARENIILRMQNFYDRLKDRVFDRSNFRDRDQSIDQRDLSKLRSKQRLIKIDLQVAVAKIY